LPLPKENADRLTTLDGLRGLAAIAVALLHGSAIFNLGWVPLHAYLAVDFFFLLSGYVIAHAFDRRLRQGWAVGFLQRRLIRLYPFIVVGSLIGFAESIIHGVFAHTLSISQALLDLLSALLVSPTPPFISTHWRIFPVDAPLWSLFFEIGANIVYAVAAPFLGTRRLWALVGLLGVAFAIAVHSFNGSDIGLGYFKMASIRAAFSFSLGVALYRVLGPNPRNTAMPFAATPVIFIFLTGVLLAPTPPGWAYDALAIFAIFPALLVLATSADPGGPRVRSLCTLLGQASYPLYVIHLPVFLLVYGALFDNAEAAGRAVGMTLTLAGALLMAWLLATYYDQPVRRWALRRWIGESSPIRRTARWKNIVRLFTERGFASRVVRGRVYGVMRNRLGLAAPMLTEDRRVLEQIIFEHYRNDPDIKSVLFVGCDSYTAHYQHRYFAVHDYWTIDPNPGSRRFGATQHINARLEDLGRFFPSRFFDLVILNGVYGWGLNGAEDCDAAVSQCHSCLTEGGHFLIGWNDVPGRDPAPLSAVPSLARFSEYAFPAFGAPRYLTDTPYRHTYWFFRRMNCAAGAYA
jgi:peptidoglycan/LPS O-acetylase OafA/YrhL